MISAISLNLKRSYIRTVIDNFVNDSIKNTDTNNAVSLNNVKTESIKLEDCEEILSSFSNLRIDDKTIQETICVLLQESTKQRAKVRAFISKMVKIRLIIVLVLFLDIILSAVFIVANKSINQYIFCFVIFALCCISLLLTVNLIIKDWKKKLYE